ncbi:exodeoxyribonuclease V subunit beta [Variovorax sp. dw_954]|uniref:exodeoxyribonuclease V subunit beta n=1 Tax=Variovorax sp. dw_954 TaxID=2720078 RepID=UPI001BD3D203|nr:exodeoxyribonuclease V subunit beta [Variovorax sp. dw_954]
MTRAVTPPLLQPLSFPLRGSRLIEASAGTGKTFTIAALYLRLVLGHGGAAAFTRALTPPEILVVTFTEAATKELRDRIRARLAEAAEAFAVDPATVEPAAPGDDLLHQLRADYPPTEWLACARALRLAAEWMDEAAVSTIHGWCNRMLREHAFDSGALFTQTLEADQAELRAEVLRDYWRTFFTPLTLEDATQVSEWWATPAVLSQSVRNLLTLTQSLDAGTEPAVALRVAREEVTRELAAIKAPWSKWADELEAIFDKACAARQVDGRKLQARFYQSWLSDLRDWAHGDAVQPLPKGSTAWTRLTPGGIAEAFTKGVPAPDHPALDDMLTLRERLAALPDAHDDVLRHVAHWAAARLATEQARRAEMGFDELLARLDAALQGPNGPRLAALIRTQFPVALIDEFQDTDPLQYRIFDAVYGVAANAQDTALVLIGDPKQAIYAFRGADIHTYLAARRDAADRHSTLGTNYRSTTAMVDAVNRVFRLAEDREDGKGAFLFRSEDDNPLPFHAVEAQGRKERWTRDNAPAPALTCWTVEGGETIGSGDAQQSMSAACATEIVRLLAGGQAGTTGFVDAVTGTLRPVQPGDIAILVNKGSEAMAVRQALGARNVRSVYLSDKGLVFQSPVAVELERLLMACAEPDDDRPLRAALACAVLALSWPELDRLNHDELAWEDRVLQFRRYQQMWQRQGVLPMLRQLLQDFAVPQRLLAAGDDRTLTDLLHLAELLQHASVQVEGEHGLIRWLSEQRGESETDNENDARKLRLESDADLVKVVTVHKSKGLEYPLVFLPFATAFRAATAKDLPLKWHDDQGRLVVALQAGDEAVARVDEERLGEDLRKLYVALTRARFATWVGVAPLSGVERSALGYLLNPLGGVKAGPPPAGDPIVQAKPPRPAGNGQPLSPAALNEALAELARSGDGIAVHAAPAPDDTRYQPPATTVLPAPEPPLPAGPRESWWIASYSALRSVGAIDDTPVDDTTPALPPAMLPSPATAAEDIYAESRVGSESVAEDADAGHAAEAAIGGLHGFPRGAGPGSFLHGLLEWVGRKGFARVHADADAQADLADLIARRCNLNGWSTWIEPLRKWLLDWLGTPLRLDALISAPTPVSPASLGRVQIEMEFWLAAQQVDTRALDALVTRHTLDAAPRPKLLPQQVNGMLKGFIDLVFEHEGRYFVADYKSNWLGPRDADYTPAALRKAVLHHRYELQYVLYIFALHRLLRSRLPDYDYERHVGGAVYVFLRGHAAPGQGLHCERPPRVLIDALDALFSGAATPRTEAVR